MDGDIFENFPHVDADFLRIKKAFSKISGYVWPRPRTVAELTFKRDFRPGDCNFIKVPRYILWYRLRNTILRSVVNPPSCFSLFSKLN